MDEIEQDTRTLADYIELGNLNLEDENYHCLVGVYEALEKIMQKYITKEQTELILKDIIINGGILEITDINN